LIRVNIINAKILIFAMVLHFRMPPRELDRQNSPKFLDCFLEKEPGKEF